MAKKKLYKRVRRALKQYELALQLGPNHPYEQPSLDRAAKSMVALHLHKKEKA